MESFNTWEAISKFKNKPKQLFLEIINQHLPWEWSAQRPAGARPPFALLPALQNLKPPLTGILVSDCHGAFSTGMGPFHGFEGKVRGSPVGLEEGRQSQSPWQLLQHVPTTHPIPSQLSLHTPGKSNGYSSFLACAGGAKSEGKGKKKITTNVPPIMSHEAELLFLPCWILPFPWYFPSSGWEPRGRRDWPSSAGSQGTARLSPAQGTTWL